jgi:hypothetical protein
MSVSPPTMAIHNSMVKLCAKHLALPYGFHGNQLIRTDFFNTHGDLPLTEIQTHYFMGSCLLVVLTTHFVLDWVSIRTVGEL